VNPERSRRCKGRRFRADTPLAREGWEGGEEGSPESEDLRRRIRIEPLAEGGFVFHRFALVAAFAVLALAPVGAALPPPPAPVPVDVHVRVEGKTRSIFGATQPLVRADASNALAALDAASAAGEFYFHVTTTSFGPYVDQVGRYPAVGPTGWVFKVNGVSPPVGADQVALKEGDTVLWYWAQFGPAGGPKTLVLRRSGGCYTASAQDDNGKTTPAVGAVLQIGSRRRVSTKQGKACIGPHRGLLVRATLDGAVRSNALP